jgi:hypothetical protein
MKTYLFLLDQARAVLDGHPSTYWTVDSDSGLTCQESIGGSCMHPLRTGH